MTKREILWIFILSSLIVLGLDLLTNSIDTHKNSWDFLYYIALAKDGFNAKPLASPFAYRYLTPFLVHGLSFLGLSIEHGFEVVAYFGAITQLGGIFFFVYWLTRSRKGAYLAMGVTALSLYNVKFLIFDIYRPDHLAYSLILVQTVLAFKRKFLLLLLVTLIASQIREFNIIPLMAYLYMIMKDEDRNLFRSQAAISAILLLPAVWIPRILIPVTKNFQMIGFSTGSLVNLFLLPLIPAASLNFLFTIVAYLIPILFLADLHTLSAVYLKLPAYQQRYLLAYTILVLFLSFYGGTDFFRFATFLFLPQIILIGEIAPEISMIQMIWMLFPLFIFNRIWMAFPDWDVESYRDFYGGFLFRLNAATLYRYFECALILLLGLGLRKLRKHGSHVNLLGG
jgi:hypothetical protein